MLLADHQIHRAALGEGAPWQAEGLVIEPFTPEFLNPASYDVQLAPEYRVPVKTWEEIDTHFVKPEHTELRTMPATGLVLAPGDFILGTSIERFMLPPLLAGRCEGKSSLGRIGLAIHVTAGFIDPGFTGQVTLEIANLSPWLIRLHAGMRIAQMAFEAMLDRPAKPYGADGKSHYQHQSGPTESRYALSEEHRMRIPARSIPR